MATAEEPLAPQKDLTPSELTSGYGYAPGVSYVNGICNPAGRRSGTQYTVTDDASMVTALANATYGDDIVIAAGSTINSTGTSWKFRSMPAPSATSPRQPPARMTTYVQQNSVSSAGVILGGVTPTSPSKMASVSKMASTTKMASVVIQGEPSYIRLMSSEAHLITNPPPHNQWHVTNYSHFAHLVQGNRFAAILETPDTLRNYAGYQYVRIEGIRFVNHSDNGIGYYLAVGPSNASVTNNGPYLAPNHYIFDRCYLDGDLQGTGVIPTGNGSNKGVSGGCDYFGFLNGRVTGVWRTASGDYNLESNTFAFSFGLGPFHIENSWLNGAGECTLFNGNIDSGTFPYPYVVADCTFFKNWCLRPLSWRESFHYNAVPPNQRVECTFSIDAGGTVVTAAFGNIFDANSDEFVPGDYFWTSTSGRPVRISAVNNATVLTLGASYTENAGGTGLRGIFTRGRQMLDGMDAKQVTLSGAGNRTVTGTGTSWLTTLKPYVDSPPPGSGVFFGVNTNLTSAANSQKFYPVLKQIASVDSDTQLTLAEDYTAGSWTNVYYSVTFWDGKVRSVMKGLHEWKASNRVRVIGNVFENSWATYNGQGEDAIAINAGNGNMGYQRDDYFGYNQVINAGLVAYCASIPWTNAPPPGNPELAQTTRVCFEHMLCTDIYNFKWQLNYAAANKTNLPYALNPAGLGYNTPTGFPAHGTKSFQTRHNTFILSTDYQPYLRLLWPSTQAIPDTQHEQLVFRDNIAHVGSHASIINAQGAGFSESGGGANGDTYDADGLSGTNPNSSFEKKITDDSLLAYNVFMRNSAATIADHTTVHGGGNAGVATEPSVGFANYLNASNIPSWLTQSTVPSDYALTTLYTTSPGVCTVSGATVTISVGSFPATIVKGTPFLVSGDSARYLARVSTRDSGSQLTLTASYTGTTGSGLTASLGFVGAASDGASGTVYTTNSAAATVSNASPAWTETFTHADASSLSADQTWTQFIGSSLGITSNQGMVQNFSPTQVQLARCDTSVGSADHEGEITVTGFTNSVNAQVGLICRKDGTATETFYYFRCVPASGHNFEVGKAVAGVYTGLLNITNSVPSAPFSMKFRVQGTTLTAFLNGSQVGQTTDASIAAGNFVGVFAFRGVSGDSVTFTPVTAALPGALNNSVTLSSGSWPSDAATTTLFPRTFLVSGDAAGNATTISTRVSSTEITLASAYPGTTGAGLTGSVLGTLPTGATPGVDTTTLTLLTGSIRT